MRLTKAQMLLRTHLQELGIVAEAEYQFHPERKWRFDLADLTTRTAYECDGGQWSGGHMRGKALESQYEKDRCAQLQGWRIFRFTNRAVLSGEALQWLKENLSR